MDSNIMSDRSPIIHSRGGFVRLSVSGKYYWLTGPYRNQGNWPDMIYSGSQKSEVCPMPTQAYALCPRRPMPMSTSYESSKGYNINSGCTEIIVECWLLTVEVGVEKLNDIKSVGIVLYSSLSSLSLYPLCPLRFNHSDTTGMDITTYSQRKRPNNLGGGYIQQIPCLWMTPACRSIPPYFINPGYAVYYRFVRW